MKLSALYKTQTVASSEIENSWMMKTQFYLI